MAGHKGGISRILHKLERNVEDGNYYEAHQMYKTLSFRYLSTSLITNYNNKGKFSDTLVRSDTTMQLNSYITVLAYFCPKTSKKVV